MYGTLPSTPLLDVFRFGAPIGGDKKLRLVGDVSPAHFVSRNAYGVAKPFPSYENRHFESELEGDVRKRGPVVVRREVGDQSFVSSSKVCGLFRHTNPCRVYHGEVIPHVIK